MRVTLTEKVYCIEPSDSEMREILKRDRIANEHADRESMRKSHRAGANTLASLLLAIPGVREANYDPMFGPCIWVRIDIEESTDKTLIEAEKVIIAYAC